jgi:hypothetical protein
MPGPTNKDAGVEHWRLNDDVIRLRPWATENWQLLPSGPTSELVIGSSASAWLRLEDEHGRVSRRHATLFQRAARWWIRDEGSTNGMLADRAKCNEVELEPGMEIWLGGVTLVAESERSASLRAFLGRLLGWDGAHAQTVDTALRSIRFATLRQAALVLCGEDEVVRLARALHLRVLGAERPFVLCDPRRKRADENVRAAENYRTGMEAVRAAKHGSLCIWHNRLPADFAEVKVALGDPDARVQLVVCMAEPSAAEGAEAFGAVPIVVPSLVNRAADLRRIVDEYAFDLTTELKLPRQNFPRSDQDWIIEHASSSHPEIEKVILRILQIRETDGNLNAAAALLGMDRWALDKWVRRWNPPVPVDRTKARKKAP